jgi:hypothetical protein
MAGVKFHTPFLPSGPLMHKSPVSSPGFFRPLALLLDAQGQELYHWIAAAPKARLAAGETAAFRARLAAPPVEGRRVLARFAGVKDLRVLARFAGAKDLMEESW